LFEENTMPATAAVGTRSLPERAFEVLRRAGNPFRNYFARNPDDEVCARYHVPELFAREREQLLKVVDLYRYEPTTHSEVVPVLGNKGAGKTHLLHSIKHGGEGGWQLLVTPGVYPKDSEFLEYLLFQVIDTLLGGGVQKGARPLTFVGEETVRGLLHAALAALAPPERLDLFPAPGLGRWARKLGLGGSQALERTQWLMDQLVCSTFKAQSSGPEARALDVHRLCGESGLEPEKACQLVLDYIDRTEAHNTAGLMRRHIQEGYARAVLLGDESDLAGFLTYGFAELDFQVRPSRQELVLALFKAMMDGFRDLKIPVVVAFDQLEDLLLARRTDDAHKIAEAFFAGIVQALHQIDGICFLIFAERGLWNRFVPSLDGYIQDRLNNPIHVPEHGTLTSLRLEAPTPDLARRVVEARMRPALEELPDFADLPSIFPFTDEQVERVARTEPTLRDMLQQYRHVFDHVVYGSEHVERGADSAERDGALAVNRLNEQPNVTVKSVIVVETAPDNQQLSAPSFDPIVPQALTESRESYPDFKPPAVSVRSASLNDLWDQEMRSARRKLEPDGSLTGATRELHAGLGAFLQICHEHGVKVGPWRMQHVVPEWTFGEHPTYGVITIAHWSCKDGQPWKVGVGPFLGRGPAKPKDLSTKLASLDVEPAVIDHLILLRPEDDLALSGKSKTLWQEAERRGRHARLEAVSLDAFAVLYGFPRFTAALSETLPAGQPLPNLADLIQEKCEKLLEQVCMPVQGG
jgi:hypothetical protein